MPRYKLTFYHFRIYVIHSASSDAKPTRGDNIISGHVYGIDTIPKKSGQSSITVFDSYGKSPTSERVKRAIENYVKTEKAELNINEYCYQEEYTTICSHILGYILMLRSRNFTLKQIQKSKISRNRHKNLDLIPPLVESLLPKKVQQRIRGKTRFNWRVFN